MSLNSLINKEFEEPKLSGTYIGAKIQNVVEKRVKAHVEFPYILSEEDENIMQTLFGGILLFTKERKSDHPQLKFTRDQLTKDIFDECKKHKRVLLIGTTYKEMLKFSTHLPRVRFDGIIGKFSLKDQARIQDGLIKANYDIHLGPGPKKDLAEDFISCVKHGNSEHFAMHYDLWSNREYDLAVCVDSLYDMTVPQFFVYAERFRMRKVIATYIFAPELRYSKYTHNNVFDVEFLVSHSIDGKDKVHMRYLTGVANGYTHDYKTFLDWQFHILYQNGNLSYFMEVQKAYHCYSLVTLHQVGSGIERTIVSMNRCAKEYRRIFDANKFFKYGKLDYFLVDRNKYEDCLHYCERLPIGSFEPTKMISQLTLKLHKIIIGGREFSKNWKITDKDFQRVIFFVILHSTMLRGELFQFTSEIVQRSKEEGLINRCWVNWLNRFKDWITRKKNRKFLTVIQKADEEFCQDYLIYREKSVAHSEVIVHEKPPPRAPPQPEPVSNFQKALKSVKLTPVVLEPVEVDDEDTTALFSSEVESDASDSHDDDTSSGVSLSRTASSSSISSIATTVSDISQASSVTNSTASSGTVSQSESSVSRTSSNSSLSTLSGAIEINPATIPLPSDSDESSVSETLTSIKAHVSLPPSPTTVTPTTCPSDSTPDVLRKVVSSLCQKSNWVAPDQLNSLKADVKATMKEITKEVKIDLMPIDGSPPPLDLTIPKKMEKESKVLGKGKAKVEVVEIKTADDVQKPLSAPQPKAPVTVNWTKQEQENWLKQKRLNDKPSSLQAIIKKSKSTGVVRSAFTGFKTKED